MVVLPAPLGPRMPVTAPRAAVSESPSTAAIWPYRLTSPWSSTAGAAGSPGALLDWPGPSAAAPVLTHASLRGRRDEPGGDTMPYTPMGYSVASEPGEV